MEHTTEQAPNFDEDFARLKRIISVPFTAFTDTEMMNALDYMNRQRPLPITAEDIFRGLDLLSKRKPEKDIPETHLAWLQLQLQRDREIRFFDSNVNFWFH